MTRTMRGSQRGGSQKDPCTIILPRSFEADIRDGTCIMPMSFKLPRIKGWDVQLRCQTRGWLRLYLCGGEVDQGGYEIEDWTLSFRIADINKGTSKTIEFKDGDAKVRLTWEPSTR